MVKEKNYCETHHLYYSGYRCPMCESERLQKLSAKYTKKEEPKLEPNKDKREASIESIQRLINKFKK